MEKVQRSSKKIDSGVGESTDSATLVNWQSQYPFPLNENDAREIEDNLADFFSILRDWKCKEQDGKKEKDA